ncbi:uncharacterized protein EI97DRAFT_368784 [Westerdykella ornata]|uniref:Zn(2)-C6 fungal-type domain-containing protein n=1 Tax=Westerdykella ornata TaxID=318751 RepID=A0A6A6JWA3_WESOR|nr:uncharacterized protein EI97DRAFT_368784 [Westerdykella ornata]KAF2280016.1 hypothetical protein EI97DRAFT_368784 [Westerdykella ornata]
MNRLPSIPSRPAPPHTYSSYDSYQRYTVAPSQSDIFSSSRYHPPREPEGGHNNAQKLPSLRTLLEPEYLDTKLPDPPPRLEGGRPAQLQDSSVRYGSSSPTLKRRHDFDGYSHSLNESNAIASRVPHVQHAGHHTTPSDPHSLSFSMPAPTPHPHPPESSRHGSFGRPLYDTSYRQPSTATAIPASSNPLGTLTRQPAHDEASDPAKPARRRTEGSSRAPVRASRCIGERVIPGEGLCWIYEDGTFCRAVIDGEPVNPSWGITKAGKPRKRLAQACLTCREKKIKCEPGYPKCHQCAKSQRACRGGLNQLGMSNASGETSPSSSSGLFKNPSMELVSPVAGPDKTRALEEQRDTSRTTEAWSAAVGSSFRLRNPRPTTLVDPRGMSVHSADSDWSGSFNPGDPDDPRRGSHHDQLALQWEQDPYETDPSLTMHLLDLYFRHAGRATYGMFPPQPFSKWVEANREKNQDHLMLLYSVLAIGSIYSPDPDKQLLGKRFAAVAAYAMDKRFGKFTLQLCQSRLMLALYNFARGNAQEAWDYCGAGIRALSALKLNTEEGIKELRDSTSDLDYGLDSRTWEECCRRTFWFGFLMDVSSTAFTATTSPDLMLRQRYNGFCGGNLCVISIEDVFVRLPCVESSYESSSPGDTPYFDLELLSPHGSTPPVLGHMACLILISAIWGEVLTFTRRAAHRPDAGFERLYEAFYSKTYERLDSWCNMLPPNLQYTPQNLENSIVDGTVATFVGLHALYHTTVIRLNRHVRLAAFSNESVGRNIERSFRTASNFLSMIHSLTSASPPGRLPGKAFYSTPFPGYALMLSVDVITSAGTVPTLPALIESIGTTIPYMEELATIWASARFQQKAISQRLNKLVEVARQEEQGVRNGSFGDFWRVPDSLDTGFGAEDAVYGANDQMLFEVIGKLTGR